MSAGDDVEIALDAVQVHGAAGVGRVIAAGAHGGGLVDRRVVVGPLDPCGECDVCRRGGAAVCPTARRRSELGARVIAAARWLVPLDDGLDLPVPAAAAIAGDVATAYTLYARTGAGPREPVVVVGAAPIGRFLIEILLAKGLAPAAAAPPGAWADWLRSKGVPVAGDRPALVAAFAEQGLDTRPWRVICADPAATATAAELAGPRATLTVLAGAPPPPVGEAVSWGVGPPTALPAGRGSSPVGSIAGDLLAREVSIIAVAGPHPDLVVETAAMCAKGEIDLAGGTTLAPDDPLRTHIRTVR